MTRAATSRRQGARDREAGEIADLGSPTVCVVMAAYNAAATLPSAAASVLAQSYENVVLAISVYPDDDATIAAAAALDDPRVRIVRRDGHGIANARNSAMRAVEADLYMFLDSDDVLGDDVVRVYVEDVAAHPGAALRFADWTGVSPVDGAQRPRRRAVPGRSPYEELVVDNYVATGTVMVDASVLEDVGLFDESFDHAEDWELWLRIARRYRLRHVPVDAFRYTETKLERLYPRSFFDAEREIVLRQEVPARIRRLAIGLCKGRYGLYYLRTLRARRSLSTLTDVRPLDLFWTVPLLVLRVWRLLAAVRRGRA